MELPDTFALHTRQLFGEARYRRFAAALDEEPPVSVRLNAAKRGGLPTGGERVPWATEGYYLTRRPAFTFDPLLHAGCYYVQEAASMFVGHALRHGLGGDSRPLVALDLCAAPGGKSIATLDALPPGSVMVSNEPVRQRAQVLAENIAKWGNPRTLVTNNYPEDFLATGLVADVVVCDVPCSGEGMFRKDAQAVGEWSPQNVEKCRRLQRDIVDTAWRLLAGGGLMVYSTCTFNLKEDEENVRWAMEELGAEALPVPTEEGWGIGGSLLEGFGAPVYRFIPGLTRGEGLFMALLRKPADGAAAADKPKARKEKGKGKKPTADGAACLEWLDDPSQYTLVEEGGTLHALPVEALPVYNRIYGKLRLLKSGVALAQRKGRDLVPQHQLALCTALRRGALPEAELAYGEALAYLRREPVPLPHPTPRGYVVPTYRGMPLGLAKNLGARANNLYPQEWRIKSSHAPDAAPQVLGQG